METRFFYQSWSIMRILQQLWQEFVVLALFGLFTFLEYSRRPFVCLGSHRCMHNTRSL